MVHAGSAPRRVQPQPRLAHQVAQIAGGGLGALRVGCDVQDRAHERVGSEASDQRRTRAAHAADVKVAAPVGRPRSTDRLGQIRREAIERDRVLGRADIHGSRLRFRLQASGSRLQGSDCGLGVSDLARGFRLRASGFGLRLRVSFRLQTRTSDFKLQFQAPAHFRLQTSDSGSKAQILDSGFGPSRVPAVLFGRPSEPGA
jgi:hypothetical protein